jgi:putative addiction module component (TIGR02574 family)
MQFTPEEIAQIPRAERLEIIGKLWDSLDPPDVPLTDAQKAELDRRLALFEQDKTKGITVAQLKANLTQRLRP